MGVYQRGVPINLVERFFVIDPITDDSTPADPSTVTFTVYYPDDTKQVYTLADPNVSHPALGVFVCSLSPPLPTGSYRYTCEGGGAVVAKSLGAFDVLEDDVLAPVSGPALFDGPCQPWINGDEVAACCDTNLGTDTYLLEDVAVMASHLLFQITARQYNGICERTVRPSRDTCKCFGASRAAGLNTFYWTSAVSGSGWWTNECGDKTGCGPASYVPLAGVPVREILEVKIDGAVLSPAGYRLEEHKRLIRLSDPGPPVAVQVWPACQDLSLNDDQPGTFSIKYRYGRNAPALGRAAAAELACELWKACPGNSGECRLPSKVTRVVRQGITIERLVPLASMLATGATGLQMVDAFVAAANPNAIQRQPAVFSPDLRGYGRRVG